MFQGFSPATGDFIWSLAMNNDRTWFMEHKEEFEAVFNQPFKALAADTCAIMRERWPKRGFQHHVSRIYRDARRLFGRGPYKDHLWFTIYDGARHNIGPMLWFELDGTSYSYGAGFWDDAVDVAQAFRNKIDEDPARFERMVTALDQHGPYRMWGETYKRPKGDRGPVINPWYNRKHISVGYEHGYGPALYSPDLPRTLADAFDGLLPFFDFYTEVYTGVLAERAAMRALSLGEGETEEE